jgi:hypothetical protein
LAYRAAWMQLDLEVALRLIERFGLPLMILAAILKGWLVPGYVYRDAKSSEREFRDITLRNAELAKRSVTAAERVVEERKL